MANAADLAAEGCESASSTALENGHQFTTTQSVLYGIDGRNTDGSAEAYIYIFDSAVAAVNGTSKAVSVIEVAAAGTAGKGNFSWQAPACGQKMKNGIYLLGCSTDFANSQAFTPLASNKIFFHCNYASEDGTTNPS